MCEPCCRLWGAGVVGRVLEGHDKAPAPGGGEGGLVVRLPRVGLGGNAPDSGISMFWGLGSWSSQMEF